MFHKIKSVRALKGHILSVQFSEGISKTYDINPLKEKLHIFRTLDDVELFDDVKVDTGGYGVVWNDELDLSCDELWDNGTLIKTPFDGLISFGDATELWGLNESTLRKAIEYGKLIPGQDVCKYGKQWVISMKALIREYGEPINK